jgi:hypothetical protein
MDHDDDLAINRVILALGYDPADVVAARLCRSAIEVDFIDFADEDWPLMTRRHVVSAALRDLSPGG